MGGRSCFITSGAFGHGLEYSVRYIVHCTIHFNVQYSVYNIQYCTIILETEETEEGRNWPVFFFTIFDYF